MTIDVRSVHFDLGEASRDYLDKKLERIGYAKDMIVDLIFVFTKEKDFKFEGTVNFRWGVQAHVEEHDFDADRRHRQAHGHARAEDHQGKGEGPGQASSARPGTAPRATAPVAAAGRGRPSLRNVRTS